MPDFLAWCSLTVVAVCLFTPTSEDESSRCVSAICQSYCRIVWHRGFLPSLVSSSPTTPSVAVSTHPSWARTLLCDAVLLHAAFHSVRPFSWGDCFFPRQKRALIALTAVGGSWPCSSLMSPMAEVFAAVGVACGIQQGGAWKYILVSDVCCWTVGKVNKALALICPISGHPDVCPMPHLFHTFGASSLCQSITFLYGLVGISVT